uniref:C-type lectin domain family 4 member E-like isoform X2 n=1 Tax=Gasterosteus aculeatus aculeatus TaxID=481459 RepID=UPI001A989176|nr:C-type lectin domain family 4 member E-like isoform X2 [Gasterosteus aculeatus aculeatus]
MSTPGGSLACEGMYSKLIEDEVNSRPDVGLHGKKGPQRDAGGTSEMQMKDANTSALIATISKLQQEKEELQAKLDLMAATKVPEAIKPPTRTPTRAPTRAPPVCSPDWSLFNDSCYFISRTSRDWPESKSFCESQGAHLAIILTAEEQTFLWDLLPRGHWNSYWFGITDEHTEDQWKWVDGTPLVGGFWEAGEPNNHIDEDCGYIVKTQVMERVAIRSWYDAPCSMYLPFICEKQMGGGASTAVPH